MIKLSLEEYRKAVIKEALKTHDGPICCDTVKDSYKSNKTIEQAAETAIDDTLYWEGLFF